MTKKCYGNYMLTPICEGYKNCKQEGCYGKTMTDYGACDCEYKECCHLTRQNIQARYRLEFETAVEECDFYQLIKEKRI